MDITERIYEVWIELDHEHAQLTWNYIIKESVMVLT